MDFGKVLTRAWQITWQYKVLWLFGFFLGGFGLNGGFNFRTNVGARSPELPLPFPRDIDLAPLLPAIVATSCIVLVIVVVLTALRFISEGALIASTQQIEISGMTTGRTAWNSGWRFGWRLFLITFLLDLTVAIPVLIALLLFIGPFLLSLSNELLADKELLDVEAHSLRATAEPTDEGETDGDDEVEGHLLLPE